jgi:hypothetical protein
LAADNDEVNEGFCIADLADLADDFGKPAKEVNYLRS